MSYPRALSLLNVRRLQKHLTKDAVGELWKGYQGSPCQSALKVARFLATEHFQRGYVLNPRTRLADLGGGRQSIHIEQLDRLGRAEVQLQPVQGLENVDRRSSRRSGIGVE